MKEVLYSKEMTDKLIMVAKFGKRRKRQYLSMLPLILVILFLFCIGKTEDGWEVYAEYKKAVHQGVVVWIMGYAVFSLINWRCPSCHCYLGRAINPQYCLRCGTALTLSALEESSKEKESNF